MNIQLGIRTDFSLLTSLITLPKLMNYLKSHQLTCTGLLDDYLFSSIPFIKMCESNNIKPIIGLPIIINDNEVYLYAKNYDGFKNLLKLNSIKQIRDITMFDLTSYHDNLILVIPYNSLNIDIDKNLFNDIFYSYQNLQEKELIINGNKVYIKKVSCFDIKEIKYLEVLDKISGNSLDHHNDFLEELNEDNSSFINLIDIKLPTNKRYIPKYLKDQDSHEYLTNLAKKGLNKRLKGIDNEIYSKRLDYELSVIKKMNFSDYFLIVYDYVLYAKKNNIGVGPGRGSGAGSLVCYSLGITNVDPIKYDLLFERFLNEERITMPDIDIDFEYNKRELVIDYVKERYHEENTSTILTYSTLKSKVLFRELGKVLEIDPVLFNEFIKLVDPLLSVKDNISKFSKTKFNQDKAFQKLFDIALHLEGLKNFTSTHAAGIVISSVPLDEIIPMHYLDGVTTTGITMEYLEELGLLKMDFLALKNLTIIEDLLVELKEQGINLDINNIPLDDELTLKMFHDADTLGIFQFESNGMLNFMKKLQVDSFDELYDALALFRPGPMDNIDLYIKRKNNPKLITYLDPRLEPILKRTKGIIVYQEQIMEIMVKLAGYRYSEADLVRRAMSKKKLALLANEETKFIDGCLKNGIKEDISKQIFKLILKFASYGFNKSHSVSYALISYRQAYLKSHYFNLYIKYLLNNSIGSSTNAKNYLDYAKSKNVLFIKPDINLSEMNYEIKDNKIVMPLSIIKNVSNNINQSIISNRSNGYSDIFDFVCKNPLIKEGNLKLLIKAGLFDSFNINRNTLLNNIDIILNYGELAGNLGSDLIAKPVLNNEEEFDLKELIQMELDAFGFLIRDHQVSRYQSNELVKVKDIGNYFNKQIKNVYLVDNIKKLKTKNNDDMIIINGSDETGKVNLVIFGQLATNTVLKSGDIISVLGIVEKRYNEWQINIKSLKKVSE